MGRFRVDSGNYALLEPAGSGTASVKRFSVAVLDEQPGNADLVEVLDIILEHPIAWSPQIGLHDERLLLADATAALEEAEYVSKSGWWKTRDGFAVDVTIPDRVYEQLESDVDEDDGEGDEPGQQLFFEDNLALVHWSPWCEHSDLLTEPRGVVGFEGVLGALLAAFDGDVLVSIHGGVEQRHGLF